MGGKILRLGRPRRRVRPSAPRAAPESSMDVGFIGLGQMGQAIALNLVKAGHRVVVYNRTRAKAEALASQGAEIAESAADACRRPVLITMLADDERSKALFFGDGNGLSALGPRRRPYLDEHDQRRALRPAGGSASKGWSSLCRRARVRQARGRGGGEAFRCGGRPRSDSLSAASPCSTRSANGLSSSATSPPRRISSSSAATSCSPR